MAKNARPRLISEIRSTKALQRLRRAEHERVDANSGVGAAHDLAQRRLDRLAHRRVVEVDVAIGQYVGGRLAVGDHDDLLRPVLATEQLARQRQGVVHVRAVHVVPARLRDLGGVDHPRRLGEHDDAEVVAWELRGDQRLQRHRHLLGRHEAALHRHRHRQVEHQHRRRPREVLGLLDLEIVGHEPDRRPARRPGSAVARRTRALRIVRCRSRRNGSPNS